MNVLYLTELSMLKTVRGIADQTEFEIPELKDVELTVKHAASIMRFVLKKISEPSTGQGDIF